MLIVSIQKDSWSTYTPSYRKKEILALKCSAWLESKLFIFIIRSTCAHWWWCADMVAWFFKEERELSKLFSEGIFLWLKMANASPFSHSLAIKKVINLVGDLTDLVTASMGPNGKAVMINIHSPKQIIVTKSGLDIIQAIRGRHHPLGKHTSLTLSINNTIFGQMHFEQKFSFKNQHFWP